MNITKYMILFAFIAIGCYGCASTGPATSPDGPATSGNAQNIFNFNINTNNTGVGGGSGYTNTNGYRVVPVTNTNPFPVMVQVAGSSPVQLPAYYSVPAYVPYGPQILYVQWPNGQMFQYQI